MYAIAKYFLFHHTFINGNINRFYITTISFPSLFCPSLPFRLSFTISLISVFKIIHRCPLIQNFASDYITIQYVYTNVSQT